RDVHDRSRPSGGDPLARVFLRQNDRRLGVDGHDAIESLERKIEERLERGRSGAIDQKIERQIGARRGAGRFKIAEVDGDRPASNLVLERREALGRASEGENRGAASRDQFSGLPADPLRSPGDENRPAGEFVRFVVQGGGSLRSRPSSETQRRVLVTGGGARINRGGGRPKTRAFPSRLLRPIFG